MPEQLPSYTLKIMLPGNDGNPGEIPFHAGHPRVAILDAGGNVAGVVKGIKSVAIEASGDPGEPFMDMTIGVLAEVAIERSE